MYHSDIYLVKKYSLQPRQNIVCAGCSSEVYLESGGTQVKNNKTQYAALGVLSLLGPMSGYDIKKFCDKSISYFWNENFGHLYPVLAQLEEAELIMRSEAEEDSRKKNYCITGKGLNSLKKWLLEPVEHQPERSEFLLKLSFGNQMELQDTLKMLRTEKERNKAVYQQLSTMYSCFLDNEHARKEPQYPYWMAALRYGINSTGASLKWFDETIEYFINYNGGEEAEKP